MAQSRPTCNELNCTVPSWKGGLCHRHCRIKDEGYPLKYKPDINPPSPPAAAEPEEEPKDIDEEIGAAFGAVNTAFGSVSPTVRVKGQSELIKAAIEEWREDKDDATAQQVALLARKVARHPTQRRVADLIGAATVLFHELKH